MDSSNLYSFLARRRMFYKALSPAAVDNPPWKKVSDMLKDWAEWQDSDDWFPVWDGKEWREPEYEECYDE